MTHDEFVLLTDDQKISILWRDAVIIAERKQDESHLFLYQAYSFYIEASYSCDLLHISKVRSFISTDELEPYLQRINISRLIT